MRKLIFLLTVVILLIGCNDSPKEAKQLSDLQIQACSAAHDAATCGTRLAEVGIVMKEECCKTLGKCC